MISAGIGRTGTFCTIHSILKRIEYELKENPDKEPIINIAQVVIGLREQRTNMVQTVVEYLPSLSLTCLGTIRVLLHGHQRRSKAIYQRMEETTQEQQPLARVCFCPLLFSGSDDSLVCCDFHWRSLNFR